MPKPFRSRLWLRADLVSLVAAGACLAATVVGTAAAATPAPTPEAETAKLRVVTSILPVQSLVAAVMDGVAVPSLLVRGGASPHTFQLKPSDAEVLEQADVVVWIGPALEGFMTKPLAILATHATIVTAMDQPGITLLAQRAGGPFEADEDAPAVTVNRPGAPANVPIDGHLWLAPDNAEAIVRAVANALVARDPAHATRYRDNATAELARLEALDRTLAAKLTPLAGRPFLVFHDAYQYLERHYHLLVAGSATIEPDQKPGARRLQAIRAKMLTLKVHCAFREPQFEPSLLKVLTEGTSIRIGILDPEGADIPPGPVAYETLMLRLGDSLQQCLGANP